MRKIGWALIAVLLMVSGVAAQEPGGEGLGDSLYPNFGNGGYDVQHYTLDMVVDAESGELDAVTTVEALATQDLSRFNLDFIGFSINEITVNDQPAAFTRDGQELIITPAEPIANGTEFTTMVAYTGVPERIFSVAIYVPTGWVRFPGGSYVLSEPDGAANFYPVNDHPLDIATYSFRVTVDEPYIVAANGTLVETIENGASRTFVFEPRDPMASYLVTINIGEFDLVVDENATDPPIRNYFATDIDDSRRALFDQQADMIAFFSEIFGPYPFDVYGAVVLDTSTGSALETQTLSVFGRDMVFGPDVEVTMTIAHELAHQWFGDSVVLADWSDIWLNEGFATYAEGLWLEHQFGSGVLDEWVREGYNYMAGGFGFVSPASPPANDLFNLGVYIRGGLTLHALRLRVGDEVFFDILRTYYERYQGKHVTTADFIALAEELSGGDLTKFFDGWLYAEDMPPIPELDLVDD